MRKGLCPADVENCERQGLVDSGAIRWSRTGVLGAAPEQTEDLGPAAATAAVTHILCVPCYSSRLQSDHQERRNRTGSLCSLCSPECLSGCR